MSLPTPPPTSHRHREKENSISHVLWSPALEQYHDLAISPKRPPTATSASKAAPEKSILKRRSPILIFPPPEPQREITPEPNDPLVDLKYLEGPMSRILNATENLRELVEAYSILAARLRASVDGQTDVDASWPLFQPFRKNREAFVRAVERDLGRALIDPESAFPKTETDRVDEENFKEAELAEREREKENVLLPSPQNTPTKMPAVEKKKRRDGMTAEQVKYARDLCTTSHAVIRLLCLIFCSPALHNVFTEPDLHVMLTAVLAIPLAEELPTPNARKTYALAIWLIQTQRLPGPVLALAADRIAMAIKRGIEGDLGKEGKKGSIGDGLKAIHDLSIYLPKIFIPAFTPVLPSLLESLLANTLPIRVQACHALGGFVVGVLEYDALPLSEKYHPGLRTRIEDQVTLFMTRQPVQRELASPTKSSPAKPASSGKQDAHIVRTLRTTLTATDPNHVAHGPVWGLCVLAELIILLGGRVADIDPGPGGSLGIVGGGKLGRVVSSLASLGMAHRRSAVRALACLMWRGIGWAWFVAAGRGMEGAEAWWKVVVANVELSTGSCVIGGLVAAAASMDNEGNFEEENGVGTLKWDSDELMGKVLSVLDAMVKKDEKTCGDAIDTLKQLVGVGSYASQDRSVYRQEGDEEEQAYTRANAMDSTTWTPASLIPHALFASLSSLMAVDFQHLSKALHPICTDLVMVEGVRMLGRADMMRGWGCAAPLSRKTVVDASMWEGLLSVWRRCLAEVGEFVKTNTNEGEVPREGDLVAVWEGLVGLGVGYFQDGGDDESTLGFVSRLVDVLVEILEDPALEFVSVAKLSALTPLASMTNTPEKRIKAMRPRSDSKRAVAPVLKRCKVSPAKVSATRKTPGTVSNSNAVQKLKLIKRLWTTLRTIVPQTFLATASERMLDCLEKNMEELTDSCDAVLSVFSPFFGIERDADATSMTLENEEALMLWAELCVDVLVVCDVDALRAFWGYKDPTGINVEWEWKWGVKERVFVWNIFLDRWGVEKEEGWEGLVILLGVPFMDGNAWDLIQENVTRWQELLDHTVNKAFDCGVDAVMVLDTLASLVLQNNSPISLHSPPPASSRPSSTPVSRAIRLVDLLLSHLNGHIVDTREIPETLMEFIGDTMREAYPPTPRDTFAYLWVAVTIARTFENCPEALVVSLLDGIGEALVLWIGDSCRAWSGTELAEDIVDLYIHVLLRIQSLPPTLEILKTYAALIEAPFYKRDHISPLAVQTFKEFWEVSYARMEQPEEGWPEEIQNCLMVVLGSALLNPVTVSDPSGHPSPLASVSMTCDTVLESPRSPSPEPQIITVPSTPAAVSRASTPTRPHKSINFFMAPPQILDFPKSPVRSSIPFPSILPAPSTHSSPTTPKRTPVSPRRSPLSNKRRRLEDGGKENVSPYTGFNIRSIAERIAMHAPEDESWTTKPFSLGKRRWGEDDEDEARPSPVKKGRVLARSLDDDSDDERLIEAVLTPTSPSLDDVFGPSTTASVHSAGLIFAPPRKRKRVFLEAVEVRLLRDIYPRLRLSTSLDSMRPDPRTPSGRQPGARQTRSVARAFAAARPLPTDASRKRRRASTEGAFGAVCSPLRDADAPRSDSFEVGKPSSGEGTAPDLPSSDDDPHFGQVTPHRLISPGPRRGRAQIEDPPSDDAVVGASPSRGVAERRVQRLGVLDGLGPISFVV